ncbi:MAG: cell division protein FtsQ/DivIB [Desulfobulbus sp.]
MALGLVVLVGWLGGRALFQSSIFVLTDIRIRGTHMATTRQVLDLAGLQQGRSLLGFDADAAVKRIKSHPWIDEVEITTHWPSAVEIRVIEHQPFALVNVEAGERRRLHYMDASGRLFADAAQGKDLDYPVITGVREGVDVKDGCFVPESAAAAAYKLLHLAAQGNAILPVQAISEVHADPDNGLIVYLVDRPFPIYFGAGNLRTKYFRLVKVLEQLYAKKQIDAVNDIRMDYLDDKVLVTGATVDE